MGVFHICGPHACLSSDKGVCVGIRGTGHRILGQIPGPRGASHSLQLQEEPRISLCLHALFAKVLLLDWLCVYDREDVVL